MLSRLVIPVAALLLASSAVWADIGCDQAFTRSYHECLRLVDSLRPDKAGQARVYGSDRSEYTAGQALWMRGQMRAIEEACARGDQAEAARRLAAVQGLIKAHTQAS